MRLGTAAAAFAAVVLPFASAECPKGCSGHGECNSFDACDCYSGFIGADCSERTCPSAIAFVDTPRGDLNHDGVVQSTIATDAASVASAYSKVQWSSYKQYEMWPTVAGAYKYKDTVNKKDIDPAAMVGGGWAAQADEAHFYAECAGKGHCERSTGVCKCFDGYEGGACQRTKCANDCSGHGTCTKVADLASGGFYSFSDSVNKVNTFQGVTTPFAYNLWDGEKNTKCVCDAGYTGSDCSMRVCPRGDDPLTVARSVCANEDCTSEVQGFTINGVDGNDKKTYRIKFFDFDGVAYYTNSFPIRVLTTNTKGTAAADALLSDNENAIKNALESLPLGVTGNVTTDCDWDKTAVNNVRCTVAFTNTMGNGLSGNIPEFIVEPVTGAPLVAQPSQPVHVFDFSYTSTAINIPNSEVKFDLFPLDLTGFRITEFTTAYSASPNVVTVTNGSPTIDVVAADIATALQDRVKGVPAFVYKHGITGASVAFNKYTNAPTTYQYVTVVMPSKLFGAHPMKLGLGGTSRTSTVDTKDGNKEASLCSNRGLCDYTSGLCSCFPGYVGKACESQSTLSM